MDEIENTLRHTGVAWEDHFAALHRAVNRKCETFGINALFKMTTTLVGEHCEEGLSDDGSMEQDMQRRMMQYAKENGFDGGNENKKAADELRRDRSRLDENYYSDLYVCMKVRTSDDMLKEINGLVAPGCQNGWVRDYDEEEKLRKALLAYATTHDFDGCDTNKCLQIFIARYTNHSRDAVGKLLSLDKYVFISVFLKSFCDSYIDEDRFLSEIRNNTIEVLRPLKADMELLSNLSGKEESCNQATTKKPYREASTTEPSATDATISEVDHTWHEKVNSNAKDAIDAKTKSLKPKSWKDRQTLHEAVANRIIERLVKSLDKKHSFVALAYLPFVDDERQAFIKLPNNFDVVRSEYASVNYVVTRRLNDSLGSSIARQWATIEDNANNILEATFATRATNLTSRVEDVGERFGPFLTQDGFRTLAALRCGYEFVWYQLGYRYFPAGYATGKHTLVTKADNEYSDKCGQIVFFP